MMRFRHEKFGVIFGFGINFLFKMVDISGKYDIMMLGSQSHAFSCKHEKHDLLTLVSYELSVVKKTLRRYVLWILTQLLMPVRPIM